MNCTNHSQSQANGMCVYCGKPFCGECLTQVNGKFYCKEHAHAGYQNAQPGQGQGYTTPPPAGSYPGSSGSPGNPTYVNNNYYYPMPGRSDKSKVLAAVLSIFGFFGFAGIHRLYVGKVGTGILWLLTGGLCGIGTIVDLILICTNGFTDSIGNRLEI